MDETSRKVYFWAIKELTLWSSDDNDDKLHRGSIRSCLSDIGFDLPNGDDVHELVCCLVHALTAKS